MDVAVQKAGGGIVDDGPWLADVAVEDGVADDVVAVV